MTFRYQPSSISTDSTRMKERYLLHHNPPTLLFSINDTLFPPSLGLLRPVPIVPTNQPLHQQRRWRSWRGAPASPSFVGVAAKYPHAAADPGPYEHRS